jgi:hypothetical protein
MGGNVLGEGCGDRRSWTEDTTLQGVKFFERIEPLLARLRPAGCERDRAGNRRLLFDHVCSLILLTFFNPALRSLRDLQAASRLKQVRKKLGCSAASLGSLSEALHVFDAELLAEVAAELLAQVPDSPAADPRLKALKHVPTAVDGSFLRRLPQITQACYATDASGRGDAGEKAVLRESLQADRCYIVDRGYEEFALFNAIAAAGSSYVCRVRNDHHFATEQHRELTA